MIRPCLALLAVLLVAGCATSPMSRIDANRDLYQSWPFEIQEAVLNGRILPGMKPEMVEMVLGKPASIMSRTGRKGEEEVWIYRRRVPGTGSNVMQGTSITMGAGGGMSGVGVSAPIVMGGGAIPADPEVDEHDVVFQNGVVIRSDKALSEPKK